MLTRVLFRKFTVSPEIRGKVISAVNAFKAERIREVSGDLAAKGVSEADKKFKEELLVKLRTEVNENSEWKEFGFDGLDEVECLLTIEDAVGVKVPDEDFHAVHGVQAALRVVEKYALREKSARSD